MLRAILGCLVMHPPRSRRQHHLVNGRRADAKIFLHVGFRRRPAVQARIEVNMRRYWPCLGVKSFLLGPKGFPLISGNADDARSPNDKAICGLSGMPSQPFSSGKSAVRRYRCRNRCRDVI
jgi:hypothetical protein